jgi:hypothetical protein
VLTAIGPVLTFPDTGERWKEREESFIRGKKGKRKEREESLESLAGLVPCDSVTARSLTVGERGESLAGERRTLVRGYRTGLWFAGEHWAAPAGGGFKKPVGGDMPRA